MSPASRDLWRELHRIADSLKPRARRAFLKALGDIRAGVDPAALQRALAAQDVQQVMRAVRAAGFEDEYRQLQAVLRTSVSEGADATLAHLKPVLGMTLSFDLKNPRAQAWLRQHGGALVREVSDETRLAIRNLTVRMFTDGIPPEKAARMLRGSIGLTARQEAAVANYRAQLLRYSQGDNVTREAIRSRFTLSPRIPAKLSEARAEALTQKYRDRFVNYRANVIATHEPLQGAEAGKVMIWDEMADAGAFDKATAKRGWIVTPDDRLCPICAPMVGQVVGYDEPFRSPTNGATARHGGQLHILCRCDDVLLLTEADVRAYRKSGQGVLADADVDLETKGCRCWEKAGAIAA